MHGRRRATFLRSLSGRIVAAALLLAGCGGPTANPPVTTLAQDICGALTAIGDRAAVHDERRATLLLRLRDGDGWTAAPPNARRARPAPPAATIVHRRVCGVDRPEAAAISFDQARELAVVEYDDTDVFDGSIEGATRYCVMRRAAPRWRVLGCALGTII